jgi:hypothetical protein
MRSRVSDDTSVTVRPRGEVIGDDVADACELLLLGVAPADVMEQHAEQAGAEQAEADLIHRPAPQPRAARINGGPVGEGDERDAEKRAHDGEQRELGPVDPLQRARSGLWSRVEHGGTA